MERKEIIEGNKLIAEFMGGEVRDDLTCNYYPKMGIPNWAFRLHDFDAMKWADTCIMVLPCGRSANTEAGWMKGAGKKVFVYSPIKQEPELMYKIYDDIFCGEHDLINAFQG